MKAGTLVIATVLSMMLIVISIGVNAQMGGPTDDVMGPRSGPGMDGSDPQGPRWEQATENRQLEKGLMFRYGKETPETSIESTDTGKDIGMKVLQLRFRNDTVDLYIQVEDEEWKFQETGILDYIGVDYNSTAKWKNEGVDSGISSEISMSFSYHKWGSKRTLDYHITVKEIPGKGNLSISLGLDTRNVGGGCCWSDDTPMEQKNGKIITLRNEDGREMSQLMIHSAGTALIGDEFRDINSTVEENIVNSTAVMDVNMDLSLEASDARFSGSLTIMDLLLDGVAEAAGFVIDHIYYFIGGAVVITVLTIGAMSVVSSKKVETGGSELDLKKNRYYRGPQ
ncbi:MAG: hypothetical protein JW939_06770 [Candidatus Thermoplasmatota archaeon]|nr:hypothetical protein [Candidatus Thermoplasmatota archaeon]